MPEIAAIQHESPFGMIAPLAIDKPATYEDLVVTTFTD